MEKGPQINLNKIENINPKEEGLALLRRIHNIKDRISDLPPNLANSLKVIIPAIVFMTLSSKGMAQTTPETDTVQTETEQPGIFPSFEEDKPLLTEEQKEDAKEKADDVIGVVLDDTKYEDMYEVAKDVLKIFKKDDE